MASVHQPGFDQEQPFQISRLTVRDMPIPDIGCTPADGRVAVKIAVGVTLLRVLPGAAQ
jgi:hypothetical protein